MILGMAFIDGESKRVETNDRQVSPNGGRAVAIAGRVKDKGAVHTLNYTKTNDVETTETDQTTLKLEKIETLPPKREASILVSTTEKGMFIDEPLSLKTDKNIPRVA